MFSECASTRVWPPRWVQHVFCVERYCSCVFAWAVLSPSCGVAQWLSVYWQLMLVQAEGVGDFGGDSAALSGGVNRFTTSNAGILASTIQHIQQHALNSMHF